MNNDKTTADLISNTYDSYEAKKILNELFTSKIRHLEMQIINLQKRFAISSPFLESRLVDVKDSLAMLSNFIDEKTNDMLSQGHEEAEFTIDCPISLELVREESFILSEAVNKN